jgi:peptidoglycan/LPS O-acetylase OafA/YrhL
MRAASAPFGTDTAVRSGKHVYATLDGIRGIAAMLVAMRHAGALFPGWDFPNSGLAVDLFFVISGFVIASAYDRRLADGLTPGAFMRIRLIRLYPLYLAGLLLGLGAGLLCWLSGTDPRLNATVLAACLLFGLVMLPSLYSWNGEIFPLNPPAWSLFFELAINAVYAVAHRFLTPRRLVAVAVLSGAILLEMTLTGQALDEGHNWSHFATGFVRVTYSFTLGIVLFHLPCRPVMSSRWSAAILLLAAAILMVPPLGAWYPLLAITLLMPALVFLGTMIEPGPKLRRGWHLLGRISYPLYVLHAPAAIYVEWTIGRAGLPQPGVALGLVFLIAMMAIAWWADRRFAAWFGPASRLWRRPVAGPLGSRSRFGYSRPLPDSGKGSP